MNANKLADKLMGSLTMEYDCDKYMEQAATMLRQQQVEIESYKNPIMAVIALSFNPITDDEIDEVYCEVFCFDKGSKPTSLGYEFCRAILRKALRK